MATPVFVMGDTIKALEFKCADSDGLAVDVTGGEVRMFAIGSDSGDRPKSAADVVLTACTFSVGNRQVTCSSTASLLPGMWVIAAGIPDNTLIKTIDNSTHFTMTAAPAADGPQTITFWTGVLCVLTVPSSGIAQAQSLGGLLDLGVLQQDVYNGVARYITASPAKTGWSRPFQFNGARPLV